MSENGRESNTLYENEKRNKIGDLSYFSGALSYDTRQEADIISAWILKNIRRRERHDYIKWNMAVKLKHYHVDAAMEIVEEYLSNDKLNTIGIVTMQMLMQASKEPTWKQYIEDLDLTVIGETEVLEAAGIDPETPSYEEVETNEFIARFFWGLIQKKSRIFVLGDTGEELQTLQKYLTETYPGIEIGGGAVVETLEESAFDSLVNEINSQTTDVIVSGLAGTRQDRFVLENSSKISAKIWLSLGEHSTLQNEAGIKTSWWGTLLKKNTFKWMVTKYNSEKDG